jgi:hypothetical protein
MIALLYPETLIISPQPVSKNKPPESALNQPPDKSLYSFSGKNLRSICVLVSTPDGGMISEEKLSFLQKILEACKCTPDDIALIHIREQQPDMEKVKSQFSPRIILFWGLQPEIPGLQYPLPDLVSVQWENITLLPVANADLMTRNNPEAQDLKRKLWTSLKKIFNL